LKDAIPGLGAQSCNAYARYEQGSSVPTVEKLDELLRAVAPDRDIVVCESKVA
jgi:transcriptional regulator with XRE-family HTH domain